jgi:hypothetical protein
VPAAIYGFTEEVSQPSPKLSVEDSDVGGIGGTLAGNALSIAAMKATLQHVLTDDFYAKAIALAGTIHRRRGIGHQRIQPAVDRQSNWAIAPNTGSVPTRRRMAGKRMPPLIPNLTATCISTP